MGYDDGECVICRLQRSGGNIGTRNRATVCLSCIDQTSENSGASDHRLIYVLKEHMECGEHHCELCWRPVTIWFDISVCLEHTAKFKNDELRQK